VAPQSTTAELARDVLENMSEAFSLVDHDFVVMDVNSAALALGGRRHEELVGKSIWELSPGLGDTETGAALKRVMASRQAEKLTIHQTWPDGRSAWLDLRILPVEAGIALFYRDVSVEVAQAEDLRATTQRLDAILGNTTMAVLLMDDRQHCVYANSAAEKLTGYSFEELRSRPLHDVVHNKRPDGSHYPIEECPIDRAFPERAQMQGEELFVARDGSFYPVAFTASPVLDPAGKPIGTVLEARGISEEKAKEERLLAQGRTVQTINRTGEAIASELDLDRVVQIVTDAAVELTGARFGAFFYNVIDTTGEKLLLYTLSGARREDFEKFGMPRATAIFHPTFVGEGVVRSDDIKKDPRYGHNAPHQGMPSGHLPVTSYLAVPVQSRSGEVTGGLFLGHPDEARFDDYHEQLMTGVAAQAAIAIDNARLYQAAHREIEERRRAETALRELNETLESRVQSALAEQQRAEDALRQAQKMEAVGQLTGGIAHDFNNLLTVVTGNIDMAARSLAAVGTPDARAQRALQNAMKGAERAASLTQRLLAFSRRQPLAPKALDVDRLVVGMSDLLNRALGETVKLEVVTSPGLWTVEADPNQLENAILNLAVNARDAMPQGGELVVETANARLDEEYSATHAEVAPGQYVVIAVTDTGEGMAKHIQERVFEPFYTTKDPGKGTGLGLSMVYGFVKQSGGHIKVYSEEGHGTTIKIYLPRLLNDAATEEESEITPGLEGSPSAETILVVEDDDDVRAYTVECLRELGYRVLEAHDGPTALRLLERQTEPVDLLFTDVVMPGMSGRELADAAREKQPLLRVLYTSGYTRNAIVHGGRLDAGVEMVAKPFTYSALAQKVRDVLDAGRTGRVLVVEDETTVRALAMELLSTSGYSVDEAGNATEALSKIRSAHGRYDVIFVAENLSDHPGHWLVAELRKLHADIPVLLAAEDGALEALTERFSDDHCTGAIAKPYTGSSVVEALTSLGVRCRKA
jgi:PAS domain S-box-containing protein